MSKQISRKEFLFKTLTGVAALGIIPEQFKGTDQTEVHLRKLEIQVS
jgi:hypothetical protein